jgi:hypothetical protein
VADAKPIVIFGAKENAEIAYRYFTHASDSNVVAFTVEQAYRDIGESTASRFEEVEKHHSLFGHDAFVALFRPAQPHPHPALPRGQGQGRPLRLLRQLADVDFYNAEDR